MTASPGNIAILDGNVNFLGKKGQSSYPLKTRPTAWQYLGRQHEQSIKDMMSKLSQSASHLNYHDTITKNSVLIKSSTEPQLNNKLTIN